MFFWMQFYINKRKEKNYTTDFLLDVYLKLEKITFNIHKYNLWNEWFIDLFALKEINLKNLS